jgi:hypothetical protein
MEELENKSYVRKHRTLYFFGLPIDVFTSQYEQEGSISIVWKRRNKNLGITGFIYRNSDGSISIPEHERNRINEEKLKDPLGYMIFPVSVIIPDYYPNFHNDLYRGIVSGMVRRNTHYPILESQEFLKIIAP